MNVKVKQHDITDCGAACLASVAAFYKYKLPISKIRQWAGTDKKGTNAWGLIKAAEKMGFSAKGVKGDISCLPEIPCPAIAHVVIKEKLQHYVVVLKTGKSHVKIMDIERDEEEDTIEITKDMAGDIHFKDVSFSYGTRIDVFENFNLQIGKAQITAIIGESGSGKTTIAALLQKLYPVNEGNVYIGNVNVKYVSTGSLRWLVGIVPQNLELFSGNVIENIAVGEFEPGMQHILDVCQQLGILEFIEQLPAGFKTYIGENGATLSGGEKQRLAIARTLYRNPEILILDEATSSLDSKSEKYVQETIKSLKRQGKTIIIIAHRMGTVINADKIVVLKQGKLIEEGSHKELYKKQGTYYEMWQKQLPILES